MKLFNNSKKGIDFMILLVPVVILTLSLLAYNVLEKAESKPTLTIGNHAISILEANTQASKDLIYLDLSVEKSAIRAIYRLTQNNILFERSCGTINEHRYWNNPENPSEMCVLSIHDNYKKYLTKELNKHLITKNLENNYEYYITDETIHGIALENWKYNILNGEYSLKPSFKVKFENKLNSLEKLRNDVEKMLNLCSNVFSSKDLMNNCVNQFTWNYEVVTVETTSEYNDYFFKVNADMGSLNKPIKITFTFAVKIPWVPREDK